MAERMADLHLKMQNAAVKKKNQLNEISVSEGRRHGPLCFTTGFYTRILKRSKK